MATAPANGLLQLLSLSPSSKATTNHHHQQQQQGGKLRFLSLSPPSTAMIKCKKKRARPADDAFQCRTCGRRFATFQALGGHRTSHKRPRVRADGHDLLLGARPAGKSSAASSVVHPCHTCGTVFPTGQALGGHMRRHRAAAETEMATTVGLFEDMDGENDEGHLRSTLIQFI